MKTTTPLLIVAAIAAVALAGIWGVAPAAARETVTRRQARPRPAAPQRIERGRVAEPAASATSLKVDAPASRTAQPKAQSKAQPKARSQTRSTARPTAGPTARPTARSSRRGGALSTPSIQPAPSTRADRRRIVGRASTRERVSSDPPASSRSGSSRSSGSRDTRTSERDTGRSASGSAASSSGRTVETGRTRTSDRTASPRTTQRPVTRSSSRTEEETIRTRALEERDRRTRGLSRSELRGSTHAPDRLAAPQAVTRAHRQYTTERRRIEDDLARRKELTRGEIGDYDGINVGGDAGYHQTINYYHHTTTLGTTRGDHGRDHDPHCWRRDWPHWSFYARFGYYPWFGFYRDPVYYTHYGRYHYRGSWFCWPRTYYVRYRPSRFYFFIDLGDYDARCVPTYVREVQVRYESEPVEVYDGDDALSRAYWNFARQRYWAARVYFDKAIARHDDDGLLYLARAQAGFAIHDYRSAARDLERGMELIPDWADVRLNLVELYSDPEEFDDQLRALERWVNDHPRDVEAHFVLGYTYFFLQEYEQAKTELIYTLACADEDHPAAERLLETIYEREALYREE